MTTATTIIGMDTSPEAPLGIMLMEVQHSPQVLHIAGSYGDKAMCGAPLESWQFIEYRRNLATSPNLFDLATTANRCEDCLNDDRLPF